MAESYRWRIHLLVTDVVMPRGNGRDLAKQLTARRDDLKVLYMSGYTDSAIVNTGLLKKEVAFVQKPFTPGIFLRKVREVLEGGSIARTAGG